MVTTILSAGCALVISLILIFPLGDALKRHSWAFYAIAALIIGAHCAILLTHATIPPEVRFANAMIQRGHLSTILFIIVMFTGALDEESSARHKLQPLRAELSILSFIFIIGHVFAYLQGYIPMLTGIHLIKTNVIASIAIAIMLSVIFFLLAITSFKFIRSKMEYKNWKRLQKLSYAMVALLALHIIFVFGTSTTSFGQITASGMRMVVYLVVFVAYAILRVRKALRDQKKRIEQS